MNQLTEISPCTTHKVFYMCKKHAKADLKRIKSRGGDDEKPVRAYKCAKCSGWHLTARESNKFRLTTGK